MQITKITDKQDLLLNPKKKYLSAEVLQENLIIIEQKNCLERCSKKA